MTNLIIIRHAESAYNLENKIQGHMDSGLTEKGFLQARFLAQRVKELKIDKIYSSDLGRAHSTTLAIVNGQRDSIILDPKLREINLGDWEGKTPQEVDAQYDNGYQRWLVRPSSIVIPNSEKLEDFKRRVTERVHGIAEENVGKTVLMVTHGGVIVALLSHWLGADFDRMLINLQIDNTSITLADALPGQVRLKIINDTSHLLEREPHGSPISTQHP